MRATSLADDSLSPSRPADEDAASAPLVEISNAMVHLYKEAFGRGPTKARTRFAGPDTILVVLEDTFTAAERTMVALGEVEELRKARLIIQEALEERARSAVDAALRRRTVAFITGVDPRYDIAINMFTLEPAAVERAHQNGAAVRSGKGR
jgi:uncharacterized protein YbcI